MNNPSANTSASMAPSREERYLNTVSLTGALAQPYSKGAKHLRVKGRDKRAKADRQHEVVAIALAQGEIGLRSFQPLLDKALDKGYDLPSSCPVRDSYRRHGATPTGEEVRSASLQFLRDVDPSFKVEKAPYCPLPFASALRQHIAEWKAEGKLDRGIEKFSSSLLKKGEVRSFLRKGIVPKRFKA